jgi:hypothetical protein
MMIEQNDQLSRSVRDIAGQASIVIRLLQQCQTITKIYRIRGLAKQSVPMLHITREL